MSNSLTISKKTAVVFVGILLATALFAGTALPANAQSSLSESQIQSILNLLESFGADQATINDVDSALRGQPTTGGGGAGVAAVCPYEWTRNLNIGSQGDDVINLQQFLNEDPDTRLATTGAGSPGNETDYYGSITAAAVAKFQDKYAAQVLSPVGLSAGTGYPFGPSTRAYVNSLCTTAPPADDDDDVVVAPGTGLSVSAGTQPSNSLAPDNAARVPFTRFTLTAGTDGPVTFKTVTVQRVGLGSNAAFSNLYLQDENGILLGNGKTLNSNNQARLGESVTIPAGQSRTYTVVGNMAADNSSRDGEQLTIRVVSVETAAAVSGSLPITGATHTVNASLSIGTATMARGALDPNTSTTKEVGTTGYTFQAVKVTAGSAEDVRVRSIRWDQTGSASSGDLANVVVVVDGTEYPTTLGADGDKYTAVFPGSGILIGKGLNKSFSIRGDIVGGSARTVVFDIEEATDVHVVGETYDYGITPTATTAAADANSSQFATNGNPFFDGAHVTISAGNLTVSSSDTVAAGKVTQGANGVNLGSFKFDVRGEGVTWSSIKFTISTSSGTGTGAELTNITLVDGNGTVLAGPEDLGIGNTTVTLSDSVTLGTGVHQLIVRGNLDNDWADGDTITVQLNPTDISSLKGDTTGQTITPTPNSNLSAKKQTVSAGSLTVTPSTNLVSQTVIGDSTQVTLGRFILDATGSGEDVRVTVAKIKATTGGGLDVDNLNTIRLYDADGNALNSGSNELNPSGNASDEDVTLTFTMDNNGYIIPKGTSKVVDLKANVATSGGTVKMDFTGITNGDWSTTGFDTGKDIVETLGTNAGATMTFSGAGDLTASLDANDPVEKWYIPGEEAEIAMIDFLAGNEAMRLTDLGLTLGASSSVSSLIDISLWDGGTKLVSVTPTFNTGAENRQTFTSLDGLSNVFDVPANDDNDITVKVKFSEIGTNKAGKSGYLVAISTSSDQTKNKARGLDSGTSVEILGNTGTSTGARVFRGLPSLATDLSGVGTNLSNATQELYRFTVSAKGNDVGIYKFSFNIATSGVTTTGFKLTEVSSGKLVAASQNDVDSNGDLNVVVNSGNYGSAQITIPKGGSRTYKLEGTTTGAGSGDSLTVKLLGDSSFFQDDVATVKVGGVATLDTATNVDSSAFDNFIWSPLSTTTAVGTNDWANGYRVPGIEFDDLGSHTRSL